MQEDNIKNLENKFRGFFVRNFSYLINFLYLNKLEILIY